MKKVFSIGLCLAILALCCAPLFFPNEAKAEKPPTVQASDLESQDTGTNYDDLPDGGTNTDAAAEAQAQTTEAPDPAAPDEAPTLWQRIFAYLKENTAEKIIALMALLQIVVNLTPTEKDNGWFLWLRRIFEFIFPNRKTGGGTFEAKPKA
jgi:hypothetical protein